MMIQKHPILCLMGPTASGKTDLMLALARQFPIEVISVDSAMIYRGMDIGTAKPTLEERILCPHHLIDVMNPDQIYSVAQFVSDAHQAIQSIWERGKIPCFVGGTMLYFHALQTGLSSLPPANQTIRTELEALAAVSGWESLHQELHKIDPVSATRIQPQDSQRICRAIEVFRVTGRPLSVLQRKTTQECLYSFKNLLLFPTQRSWLHDRIAQRFHSMIAEGLVEEVIQLLSQWPKTEGMPSLRAVGYRQVTAYLNGQLTKEEMIEKGIIATRQLAKRQCTWLRSWSNGERIDPQDAQRLLIQRLAIHMKVD